MLQLQEFKVSCANKSIQIVSSKVTFMVEGIFNKVGAGIFWTYILNSFCTGLKPLQSIE